MARKWQDIRRSQSPEAEAQISAWVAAETAKLPLGELRRARSMTQVRLAETLDLDQSAISKLEHRADIYLSTLRSYVEALGGQLNLVVSFPEGEIVLDHLGDPLAFQASQSTADKTAALTPD